MSDFTQRVQFIAPWFYARQGVDWRSDGITDLGKHPSGWALVAERVAVAESSADTWTWFVCEVLEISPDGDPAKPLKKGVHNLQDPFVRTGECCERFAGWVSVSRDIADSSAVSSRMLLSRVAPAGSPQEQARVVSEMGISDPVMAAEILLRAGAVPPQMLRKVRHGRMLLHFTPGYSGRDAEFPLLAREPLGLPLPGDVPVSEDRVPLPRGKYKCRN